MYYNIYIYIYTYDRPNPKSVTSGLGQLRLAMLVGFFCRLGLSEVRYDSLGFGVMRVAGVALRR